MLILLECMQKRLDKSDKVIEENLRREREVSSREKLLEKENTELKETLAIKRSEIKDVSMKIVDVYRYN